MAAYLIFALDITDPGGFREYAERVGSTHEQYGGKLLVPGESSDTLLNLSACVTMYFADGTE
jgi:uncharacterized protein (DUF1330 family)